MARIEGEIVTGRPRMRYLTTSLTRATSRSTSSTTNTWWRRGSGSASTWMHWAGVVPASHRNWILRSREAPQCRSGRSQS